MRERSGVRLSARLAPTASQEASLQFAGIRCMFLFQGTA